MVIIYRTLVATALLGILGMATVAASPQLCRMHYTFLYYFECSDLVTSDPLLAGRSWRRGGTSIVHYGYSGRVKYMTSAGLAAYNLE